MSHRLEELCNEVYRELNENREKRRQWFVITWDWKNKWMPLSPYAPKPDSRNFRITENKIT